MVNDRNSQNKAHEYLLQAQRSLEQVRQRVEELPPEDKEQMFDQIARWETAFDALRQENERLHLLLAEKPSGPSAPADSCRKRLLQPGQILAQLPATVWVVDAQLRFTFSSGDALRQHNLSQGEMVGKTLYDLLETSSPDHPTIASHCQALRGEEVVYHYPAGEMIWEAHLKPVHDPAGGVCGVLGFSMDVTDRKRVEADLFNSRQMLELILNTIPQRVFWKDRDLRYLGCNQLFAEDAGGEQPQAVVGKTDFELSWVDTAENFQADDREVIETGRPKENFEEMAPRRGMGQLWVRTTKAPLRDQQGNVIGVLGTYEDITDRKMAEEQLQQANEKLIVWVEELEIRNRVSSLLRQMDDLLQVCDRSEDAFAVIEQFGPEIFPGTSGCLALIGETRRSLEAVASWGSDLQTERVFGVEECWAMRRGQVHYVMGSAPGLHCRHVPDEFSGDYLGCPMSAAGEMLGLLHIETPQAGMLGAEIQDLVRTVSEHLSLSLSNLKLRETLRSQSVRDPLSKLFNRRYMEESLDREISRAARKKSKVGLIMLDIDHFKNCNDSYGHEAGDMVIRELGAYLKSHIRSEDIACRFGGEEFILIMPDAPVQVTLDRAELIRAGIANMMIVYQRKSIGTITASLGVASFPASGLTAADLLKAADTALYQAKHNGRNRVECC